VKDENVKFEVETRVVAAGRQPPFREFGEDLRDATFSVEPDSNVLFEGVAYERVDLSGIRFWQFHARESVFIDCDFSRISSREGGLLGDFPKARFVGCNFSGADLRHLQPGWGRFERCVFTDIRIRDWKTYNASFVDCIFGGRIEKSTFFGRRNWLHPNEARLPPANDFHGNDFSRADLIDVSFREGVDLKQQRLPEGPQYMLLDRWPERVARTRKAIAKWEPEALRRDAAKVLEIYSDQDDEQTLNFIRLDDLGRHTPREVLDRIHEDLARPFPTDA
jgi:uncharacterized protein YjbI with pentapeptide repeats